MLEHQDLLLVESEDTLVILDTHPDLFTLVQRGATQVQGKMIVDTEGHLEKLKFDCLVHKQRRIG